MENSSKTLQQDDKDNITASFWRQSLININQKSIYFLCFSTQIIQWTSSVLIWISQCCPTAQYIMHICRDFPRIKVIWVTTPVLVQAGSTLCSAPSSGYFKVCLSGQIFYLGPRKLATTSLPKTRYFPVIHCVTLFHCWKFSKVLIFTFYKNCRSECILTLWSIQLFILLTFTKVSLRLEWNSTQDMKATRNIS